LFELVRYAEVPHEFLRRFDRRSESVGSTIEYAPIRWTLIQSSFRASLPFTSLQLPRNRTPVAVHAKRSTYPQLSRLLSDLHASKNDLVRLIKSEVVHRHKSYTLRPYLRGHDCSHKSRHRVGSPICNRAAAPTGSLETIPRLREAVWWRGVDVSDGFASPSACIKFAKPRSRTLTWPRSGTGCSRA
jgi:hypothetical protein